MQCFQHRLQVGFSDRLQNIYINVLLGKSCPQQAFLVILERNIGKRETGSWAIDGQQVRLGSAVRKDTAQCEKQVAINRGIPFLIIVQKFRRGRRNMVDNQVCHQFNVLTQFLDVLPVSQTRINLGMVNRVKASIGAVNRIIEWEDVNAAKQTGERTH